MITAKSAKHRSDKIFGQQEPLLLNLQNIKADEIMKIISEKIEQAIIKGEYKTTVNIKDDGHYKCYPIIKQRLQELGYRFTIFSRNFDGKTFNFDVEWGSEITIRPKK